MRIKFIRRFPQKSVRLSFRKIKDVKKNLIYSKDANVTTKNGVKNPRPPKTDNATKPEENPRNWK